MKGFPVRPVPVENVGVAAKAVARRQAEQLTLVRRRAQPTAVYIARLTVTAVFAYLLALQLPGGSPRSVLAPLTALLVVQATLFHTIGSAVRRVAAVTVGVLAAVAVAAYVPFSWWVLGLLVAGTLALGIVLRLREEILEVPISAMLIFSVDSQAAATTRITETLVGAAAGLAAGLVFAPMRVQPGQGGGRRPEPPDGRPARPDGGGPGRGAGPEARGGLAGTDPGAARRDRAGGRRAGAGRGERPAEPQEAQGRRPGGGPAGRRRHAGAGGDGHAGAGPFGGRQRADRQRAQPGQGRRDAGPAGRRDRRAVRRGAAYGQLLEADPVSADFPRSRPSRSPRRWKTTSRRPSGSRTSSPTCSPPTRPNGRMAGSCAARSWPTWTGCAPSSSPRACRSRPRQPLHPRRCRHCRYGGSGTGASGTSRSGTRTNGTRSR